MRTLLLLVLTILTTSFFQPAYAQLENVGNCETGHWIQDIKGDGKILILEDGSMWEVSDVDTVTTSIWLPISNVVTCSDKIINVDDGETVAVVRLGVSQAGTHARNIREVGYVIEATSNDKTFVINGEVFKAQTYCFGFNRGDRVKFISGSPFGACATATFVNLRSGNTCDAWCE